jgi:hypothetical protein
MGHKPKRSGDLWTGHPEQHLVVLSEWSQQDFPTDQDFKIDRSIIST